MLRRVSWLALLLSPSLFGLAAVPPQIGFQSNVGQYSDDVLFVGGPLYGGGAADFAEYDFYQDRIIIKLGTVETLQFAQSSPDVTVSGSNPLAYPLHNYLGTDPARWRENVPHFITIRYSNIYPGINAEWNAGSGLPMLRFVVAPGADARQVTIRLQPVPFFFVTPDRVVSNFIFDHLVAYQQGETFRTNVNVTFVQIGDGAFGVVPGGYDTTRPLLIEIGGTLTEFRNISSIAPASDGGELLTGDQFLGHAAPDGAPIFLTLCEGFYPRWLLGASDGSITVAGQTFPGTPPIGGNSPQPVSKFPGQDGWIGRFQADGTLRASTFTNGQLNAFTTDVDGEVYFATADSVIKWLPGDSSFAFALAMPGVLSLAANSGSVAFATPGSPRQPVTAGAVKDHYDGPWDLYVGRLDRLSGTLQMATYLSVTGASASDRPNPTPSVALAPDGDVWIASSLFFGDGNSLVAVSADGRRVLHFEAVNSLPVISFDVQGNVLAASSTYWPNLPTDPGAALRAPCAGRSTIYVQTMSPDGATIARTYLRGAGHIVAFDGPERLYVEAFGVSFPPTLELLRVDTSRPNVAGIACVINTASRLPVTGLTPGGLSTLVGNDIGPLDQVNAALDADGKLPLELAGIQVLINGIAAPLVSVQQGLITFYTPEDKAPVPATIQVLRRGSMIAAPPTMGPDISNFALFTADNSGFGLAAAINQNGTVNGPLHLAIRSQAISIFGTGPISTDSAIYVGGVRAPIEYAGQAPGLAPGVKQVNIRPGVFDNGCSSVTIDTRFSIYALCIYGFP